MDLTSYDSVAFGLFVNIYNNKRYLLFSDWHQQVMIDNLTYEGLGRLLSITNSSSELGPADNELTISVSGIPNSAINDILDNPLKGNSITVLRAAFDPSTNTLLNIAGNPSGRFKGIVTNYSLTEEYDLVARQSMNMINIICNNILSVLGNTTAGRRTNSVDQKKFYPGDISMDNIANLAGSYFDFGRKS